MTERTTVKTCTKCGESKPHTDFHKQTGGKYGRRGKCKACTAAYDACRNALPEIKARRAENAKEWRSQPAGKAHVTRYQAENFATNADRLAAYSKEYFKINPHVYWESHYRARAKHFGFLVRLEHFTKADLIGRYGDKCFHCGGPFEQLDHYPVPVALGGSHDLENCKPSCARCNAAQGYAIRTSRAKEFNVQ